MCIACKRIRVRTWKQKKHAPRLEDTHPETVGNKVEWTRDCITRNIEYESTIKLLSPCLTINDDFIQWEMRKTIEAGACHWGGLHNRKRSDLYLTCRRCWTDIWALGNEKSNKKRPWSWGWPGTMVAGSAAACIWTAGDTTTGTITSGVGCTAGSAAACNWTAGGAEVIFEH